MITSAAPKSPIAAPLRQAAAPPEDPGQVYVTGDGFVQNFGPIVSANGTLRLYESGAAQLLAKDIELKDGIHIHGDAVKNTVSFQRPDGKSIEFKNSELKLPYIEKSDHAAFELRSLDRNHPGGFVEDVFSSGDWTISHCTYTTDGNRQDQPLPWKSLSPEQRWDDLQRFADANNSL